LETSDSCLLSWIEKIIFANNLIFIFDGNLDKIFVFDMFGKFQNEIGQIGQGPDELLSVCGFYVNEEKKYVGVLDILKHKIFRYSFDGNLIGKFDFPSDLSRINQIEGLCDNNIIMSFFNDYNHEYNYCILNEKDYSLLGKSLPFIARGKNSSSQGNYVSAKSHEDFFVLSYLSDTIYQLDGNNFKPNLVIETQQKKFTHEIALKYGPYEDAWDAFIYAKKQGYSLGIGELYAINDYLLINYNSRLKPCHIFWDISKKKGSYTVENPFNPYNLLPFTVTGVGTTYKNSFVYYVPAYEVEEILSHKDSFVHPEVLIPLENADMEDNPILIFYDIKE